MRKIRVTFLEWLSGRDVRWTPIRAGQNLLCLHNVAQVLLWRTGQHHLPCLLSPFLFLNMSALNEQVDISPNMSYPLFLECPFLHLAIMFQVYFTCHLLRETPADFPSLDDIHREGGRFRLFCHTMSQASLACPSPWGTVAQLRAGDSFMWPAQCSLTVGSVS